MKTYTITGTRQIHSVRNTGTPGVLLIKRLTCLCKTCDFGGPGRCQNGTDPWVVHDLTRPSTKQLSVLSWPPVSASSETSPEEDLPPRPAPTLVKTPSSASEMKNLTHDLQRADNGWRVEVSRAMEFPTLYVMDDLTISGLGERVDMNALALMPDDIPEDLFPVDIQADGNCLVHCGSLAAFGSQDFTYEMRVRCAIEMILHEEEYLNADFLSRGLETTRAQAHEWAQYSRDYIPPAAVQKLGPEQCRIIYRREIISLLTDKMFCGLWQVYALASVLKAKISSVYPTRHQ